MNKRTLVIIMCCVSILCMSACGDDETYVQGPTDDSSTNTERIVEEGDCTGVFTVEKVACTARVIDPSGLPSYEPQIALMRIHDYAQQAVDNCYDVSSVVSAYLQTASDINALKADYFSAQVWTAVTTAEDRFLQFLIQGLGFQPFRREEP